RHGAGAARLRGSSRRGPRRSEYESRSPPPAEAIGGGDRPLLPAGPLPLRPHIVHREVDRKLDAVRAASKSIARSGRGTHLEPGAKRELEAITNLDRRALRQPACAELVWCRHAYLLPEEPPPWEHKGSRVIGRHTRAIEAN